VLHALCTPVVGHGICNLGDRDYFIWETSIIFSGDMIKKRVKHIPSEVCPCHISFSIWSMLLVDRGG